MTTPAILSRSVELLRDRVGDRRPDAELLRRYAQDRDEDAFTALVRRHAALVFGVARRQLGDVHRVEDVFQATFLALARSAAGLTAERSLTNWLYTVALRQARKARRSDARRAAFDRRRTPPNAREKDPLEELSGRELVGLIDEELERLPEAFRLPILLCCVEGLSREEAAERLGWSPGSVKGRLERGRRRLADRLNKKGVAPSAVFLDPFPRGVPEGLVSRAAGLSASPWSAAIPAGVSELATASSPAKGMTVVAICCSLLVTGLAAAFVGSLPGRPAEQPPGDSTTIDDPLPRQAVRRFGTSRFRQGMAITSLAVSPDGTFAVAAGGVGPWESVRRFDLRDGRRVMALPKGNHGVEAIAVAPDGKTFAAKQGFHLHIYDAETGEELGSWEIATSSSRYVNHWVAYSPDGSTVALSVMGETIDFVDVATGRVVRRLPEGRVADGIFLPGGKHFVAGGHEYDADKRNLIRLWDLTTGKEIRRFDNGTRPVSDLAVSPDGKTLAAGGDEGHVRLWDVETGEPIHWFGDGKPRLWSLAFSPDGRTLAVAGDTLHLYDLETRKPRLHIPTKATGLHYSPDGKVLTAAVGGAIRRWDAATGRRLTPEAIDGGVEQIEIGLGGRVLITHDHAGVFSWVDPTDRIEKFGHSGIPSGRTIPRTSVVHLWDRSSGKLLRRMELGYQGQIAVSPDSRYLVLAVDDPKFKYTPEDLGCKFNLYDLAEQRFVDRFPPIVADRATFKAFTPDGKLLVTVGVRSSQVRVWDVATGRVLRQFSGLHHEDGNALYAVLGCRLSPDGRTLALAYARHNPLGNDGPTLLRLWDVSTGKPLHKLEGHHNLILGLAFSPDGRYLASCEESPEDPDGSNREDAFHVWDTKTGERVGPLPQGLPDRANRVAFSPDGRTFAASSFDGSVTVWEVASWSRRAEFQAHEDHVTALRFSEDGTLFTGGTDATVLEWRLRPAEPTDDIPMSEAWAALRSTSAEAAYHAQGRFLASAEEGTAFLAEHLRPATPIDSERVAGLLDDLGSPVYATRERATGALAEYGHRVEEHLRKALAETSSAEGRRRLERLLTQLEPGKTPPVDLRILRAVEVLEWLDTPESRELLAKLADGDPGAPLTREARAVLQRLPPAGP